MNIVIGQQALTVTRTSASDAALLNGTGCDAAEIAAILRRDASAAQLGRALHSMLGDTAPDPVDLAEAIAGMDMVEMAGQVADILSGQPPVIAVPNA